jgi:DNA-binding NarL/FixJ family response regulator
VVKRILLVDDSPLIQATARHALEEAGFEVATRATFDELMSQPIEGHDLILMDVQMPELFGDDVAMVLRQRGLKTPIYLFSSLDPADLAERSVAARVDGYISKQQDMAHMVQRVREILA